MILLLLISLWLNVWLLFAVRNKLCVICSNKQADDGPEISTLTATLPKEGRVIQTAPSQPYDPSHVTRKGGKVVKVMPRQLKKIKEAQESNDL